MEQYKGKCDEHDFSLMSFSYLLFIICVFAKMKETHKNVFMYVHM